MILNSRVRVTSRDGTLRGTFAGIGLRWSCGKGVDGSDVSFTASTLEDDYADDVFDDALGIVQVDTGSGYVSLDPPYLLSTSGTLIGPGETETVQVVGQTALMLSAEWQVTHDQGIWNRVGPPSVYFGWMHPDYDVSGWNAANHTTRASIASGAPKHGNPPSWECDDADWLNALPSSLGDLTLFRLGSFTVTGGPKQIRIASTADEEHKVYLFGPGYGGVITDEQKQETGYTESRRFDRVLPDGTYHLAAEMTTVNSVGGDGFDAFSFYVGPIDTKDRVTTFLLDSSSTGIKVLRQPKENVRPGFTVGKILSLLRSWNQTWMTPASASINTVTLDFTNALDSSGAGWVDVHERSWNVGTPVSQILADLSDIADFDMGADLSLKAWKARGSDVSATVKLLPGTTSRAAGENLSGYTFQATPITATRASVLTEDGYTTKVGAVEATVPARSAYLESQQSSSVGEGQALAQRYIDENSAVRKVFTARFIGTTGTVPGVDFTWGDTIQALNRNKAAADVRVLSWSGQQTGDHVEFEAELQ